jgi:hypothetical protein
MMTRFDKTSAGALLTEVFCVSQPGENSFFKISDAINDETLWYQFSIINGSLVGQVNSIES